jgi:hypothetical protein
MWNLRIFGIGMHRYVELDLNTAEYIEESLSDHPGAVSPGAPPPPPDPLPTQSSTGHFCQLPTPTIAAIVIVGVRAVTLKML